MEKIQINPSIYYYSYLENIKGFTKPIAFPILLDEKVLSIDQIANSVVDSSTNESEAGYTIVPTSNDDEQKELRSRLWREKDTFINALNEADFSTENENDATLFIVDHLHQKNADSFLLWLQDFCLEYMREEKIIIKILQLFMCFDYETFGVAAGMISEACVHNPSLEVQDTNLSLLGHWCNQKALKIMEGVEEPSDPWMKVKYRKLKEVIRERCIISEK